VSPARISPVGDLTAQQITQGSGYRQTGAVVPERRCLLAQVHQTLKEPTIELRRNSGSVVGHVHRGPTAVCSPPDRNSLPTVTQSIPHQDVEELPQEMRVGHDNDVWHRHLESRSNQPIVRRDGQGFRQEAAWFGMNRQLMRHVGKKLGECAAGDSLEIENRADLLFPLVDPGSDSSPEQDHDRSRYHQSGHDLGGPGDTNLARERSAEHEKTGQAGNSRQPRSGTGVDLQPPA